jgi:PelA/Pel-15E family pectate lyase
MRINIVIALTVIACAASSLSADEQLRKDAADAMKRAATYYRNKVATHGGYVYYYDLDLKQRWGEGEATATQIWVQPPGTPTVGMAYLRAYEATGDRFYLDAAKDAALALVHGQLESGGWTNSIDFNPKSKVAKYRNGKGGGRNHSTLDDGISQAALQLLMRAHQALGLKDKAIHEAVEIGLDALLKAQFPNGAFPQVWIGPSAKQPILKASFPEYDWRTEKKVKNYWDMYTLNDNLASTVTATLRDARRTYKDDRYKAALAKLGDFLILAQLPDPQPGWAQQYNYEMHPIWARKFEPAAITGGESQDVMEALIAIAEHTGDERYLKPIAPALEYFRKSLLKDGTLARYYELKTNRPLYMKRTGNVYTLTYDDTALPSHYGWKVASRLDAIESALKKERPKPAAARTLEPRVREIIRGLDAEGRWISTHDGKMIVGQPPFKARQQYIGSEVFSRNVEVVSEYLQGQ